MDNELPGYRYPALDLLAVPSSQLNLSAELLASNKKKIVDTFAFNGVQVGQISAIIGPTLTLYEFTPAPGTRVAKIRGLEADLSLYLAGRHVSSARYRVKARWALRYRMKRQTRFTCGPFLQRRNFRLHCHGPFLKRKEGLPVMPFRLFPFPPSIGCSLSATCSMRIFSSPN